MGACGRQWQWWARPRRQLPDLMSARTITSESLSADVISKRGGDFGLLCLKYTSYRNIEIPCVGSKACEGL